MKKIIFYVPEKLQYNLVKNRFENALTRFGIEVEVINTLDVFLEKQEDVQLIMILNPQICIRPGLIKNMINTSELLVEDGFIESYKVVNVIPNYLSDKPILFRGYQDKAFYNMVENKNGLDITMRTLINESLQVKMHEFLN